MAKLISPSPNTKVIRRAKSDISGPGKWHFVRTGMDRKMICGEFISGLYNVDTSTLEQVKADGICSTCWPFGKEDIGPGQLTMFDQLELTTLPIDIQS